MSSSFRFSVALLVVFSILLFVILTIGLASGAFAQENGVMIEPSGVSYSLRFTVEPRATQLCIHEADAAGQFVDRDASGSVTPADALGCTSSFVGDSVTPNKLRLDVTPPLATSVRIVARAYAGADPLAPRPSGPSNWQILVTVLREPVLLPPEPATP